MNGNISAFSETRWEMCSRTRVFADKVLHARAKCGKIIMHIYAERYTMRAKTGSKFIIAFSLVFLLAIFLFSFVLSVDLASASPSVNYITAEVTTSTGDFLPAGMVYDKTAVDLSFALYTSEDRATWTRDDSFAAKFDLKYYTAIGAALSSAPSEVGSYRVDVVAKDSTLAEYFNEDLYSIVKDTVIGSAAFTI